MDSEIKSISRYGENEEGPAGSVRRAVFALNRQEFMCIDSGIAHGFSFTPSMSLFVSLDTESDLDKLYAALSEGGQILMPLSAYPFSNRYAWVNDKYGLSWQLMLADK
jgi:predicted 3-demethylubiquinone-9 3-methyltransferase (glyoxalase superfamily)